jgi:beta-glucuronidase
VLDEYVTQFGIRTIQLAGSAVLLNGREMFYPGGARHEDHGTYGRSVPLDVIYNDLKVIKSLNIALLRTAHYPNHPYTYLMADRLGLAVMEEVPVWWFDVELAWFMQNSSRLLHLQMWREMIFKDYNRPSIMYWSTCNECLVQAGRQAWIAMARNDLRDNYFDGRLVTQSAAADRPGPNDYTQGSCDVAGWTTYFGIFHGSSFYDGTLQFMQNARAFNVNKPIISTEFGVWSGENIAGVEYQVKVLDSTFNAFRGFTIRDQNGSVQRNGALVGTIWWCIFDWYSSQHAGGFQSMGVYRMDHLTPKPQIADRLAQTYKPYYDSMEMTVGVAEEEVVVPTSMALAQNFPNPFNPSTTIRYAVPTSGRVQLRVVDMLGREVAILVDEEQGAGEHVAVWSAETLPSGVYLCTLTSGQTRATIRMVLAK